MIDLSQTITDQEAEIARLQTVNAELVEALLLYFDGHYSDGCVAAEAALKAAGVL